MNWFSFVFHHFGFDSSIQTVLIFFAYIISKNLFGGLAPIIKNSIRFVFMLTLGSENYARKSNGF